MIVRAKNGCFAKGTQSGRQFTSELLRGNQFAKGNPPNRTSFGNRSSALSDHPQWKGGIQFSERDGFYVAVGKGKRIPLARKIFEDFSGELVPKGSVVVHKDGDKFNNSPLNLECVSRAELMRRNAGRDL